MHIGWRRRHSTDSLLEKMIENIISGHRVIAPYGMQGGASGKPGHNRIQRANGQVERIRALCTYRNASR